MALSGGSKGNGPHDLEYAERWRPLGRVKDFKKEDPQGRGDFGRFLSTEDRSPAATDNDACRRRAANHSHPRRLDKA